MNICTKFYKYPSNSYHDISLWTSDVCACGIMFRWRYQWWESTIWLFKTVVLSWRTVKDLWPITTSSYFLANRTIFASGVPSSGTFMTTHFFSKVSSLSLTLEKRDNHFCHNSLHNTSWSYIKMHGNKSVWCVKHFPLFSTGTLPFLPIETQTTQGMQCNSVFLNKCSTFPSFSAHTPPSPLFIAC